jgi:hypothetical protein
MRRLINILILISLYLVFGSRSCVDDSAHTEWQKKEAEAAKDSIRVELESDYLSEEARYAAEIKAIQELNDLADYVEIYSDKSLDSHFREKAGEMIRDQFVSEDAGLSFGPVRKEKMQQVAVGEFLGKGFGPDIFKVKVNFDSLHVLEPLQKSAEEIYSGKLSAYQTFILHSTNSETFSDSVPITINFFSSRQIKVISQDTLMVWEVSLGNLVITSQNSH